jgi:hypothetical protein
VIQLDAGIKASYHRYALALVEIQRKPTTLSAEIYILASCVPGQNALSLENLFRLCCCFALTNKSLIWYRRSLQVVVDLGIVGGTDEEFPPSA